MMWIRSLAIVGALGSTARGFLIPPTVDGASVEEAHTVTAGLVDPYSRVLHLQCPGCLFAESTSNGRQTWTSDISNSLFLNFTIDPSSPGVLDLNGQPFYPPNLAIPQPLFAPQISASELSSEPLRLSYTLELRREQVARDSSDSLVPIRFTIDAIEDQDVQLQTVDIHLIKSIDGKVFIIGVDALPEPSSPSEEGRVGERKDCTTLLCKWRGMLRGKFHDFKFPFKGCHGPRPDGFHGAGHKGHGKGLKGHPRPNAHLEPGAHHHGHHSHHHRGGLRAVMGFIHRFTVHVLIPISIGIIAGMTASIVGMLVGRLIAYLWIKLFRGGKRGPYARIPQEDARPEEVDEKALADGDEPPQYEEVAVAVSQDKEGQ